MSGARFFTLEEARALLPRVKGIVDAQVALRERLEEGLGRLEQAIGKEPDSLHIAPSDPPEIKELKRSVAGLLDSYQRNWSELENLGPILKDAKSGLIDFYSRIDGRTVLLCWRHGEASIDWYHDVEAGFAGRKPLESVLRRQYN